MWSKYLKNTVVLSAVTAVIFGVFVSCENPFTKTLGEKVDVEWPTVTVSRPVIGSILNKEVTFAGSATAYREVDRVEVQVLNSDKSRALLGWTRISNVSGGDTSKSWSWPLDTEGPVFTGQDDGFMHIQFRAYDRNELVNKNIQTNTYIIKNKPSQIKMSQPSDASLAEKSASRETNKELRGQVIDRRGIKPGFPRIKIWSVTGPNDTTTPEPDENYWYTLFLVGNGENVLDTVDDVAGDWHINDRSQMEVLNMANFVFKLAKIDSVNVWNDVAGNEIREAVYKQTSAPLYDGLAPGNYRFRIWTSDTYFVSDEDISKGLYPASQKRWPREVNPADPAEVELPGFNPVISGYVPGVDDPTSWTINGGLDGYWSLEVKSAGQDPDVALYNTSAEAATPTPNIYITDSTSQKIATGNAVRDVFRLQIKATHPDGIASATLTWSQPGIDNTDHSLSWTTSSSFTASPSEPVPGGIYTFMAKESQFAPSSRPYALKVEVVPNGSSDRKTTKTYNVTVSNTAPKVRVESVTGAAAESTLPGDVYGGETHTTPVYTVNGNIKVNVSATAVMGMSTQDGRDLIKWFAENKTTPPANLIQTDLDTYKTNPTAATLQFFSGISNSTDPEANIRFGGVDKDGNFLFNASQYNGNDVYLYVIAQDAVQILGYTRVILKVDDSTDIPTLDTGLLVPVTGPNDLYIEIKSDKTQATSQTRKNILDRDTGIDMAFKDDDGIKLGDITVTLTDMNVPKTVTVGDKSWLTPDSSTGNVKEWAGTLSQKTMAAVMLNNPGSNNTQLSYLRDGVYKLEIKYGDDVAAKIDIPNTIVKQKGATTTFYFCVMSGEPTITVTSPARNGFVNMGTVEIEGTVTSYVPVQRLWISFKPVLSPTDYDGEVDLWNNCVSTGSAKTYASQVVFLTNMGTPKTAAGTSVMGNSYAAGQYVYYWHKTVASMAGFVVTGEFPSTFEERRFTLELAHNLGGNFPETPWSVKVDNEPPVVAYEDFFMGRPVDDGKRHQVNGKFNFVISATDNNGIKEDTAPATTVGVKWWIKKATNPASDGTYPASPTFAAPASWTETGVPNVTSGQFINAQRNGARFTSPYINSVANSANLPNGTYRLYAAAEDRAGNQSPFTVITDFDINQDADRPVLSDVSPASAPTGLPEIRNKTGLAITGKVTDDDGFKNANGNDNYPANTVQIRFGGSGGWTDITAAASLDPTGAYVINYVIPDSMKNTVGQYFYGDGTKQYEIQVTDVSANKNPDEAASGANFIGTAQNTFSGSFYLKDTKPKINFSKHDKDSTNVRPVYKNYTTLISDLSGGYVADSYLESVTVSFDRGTWQSSVLEPVKILYSGATGPGQIGTYNPGTSNTFDWNLSDSGLVWMPAQAVFDSAAVAEGLHTIIITAQDIAGNKVEEDWVFYKDTQGPAIKLDIREELSSSVPARELPVISGGQDGVTLWGTLTDDWSNIDSATCVFDGVSGSFPVTLEKPGDRDRTKRWSVEIQGTKDGKRSVTITALDALGTSKSLGPLYFVVDRDKPYVMKDKAAKDITVGGVTGRTDGAIETETERVFSAAGVTSGSTTPVFTLKGTASDANLNDIVIVLRNDSSAGQAVVELTMKDNDPDTKDGLPAGDEASGDYYSKDAEQRLKVTYNTTTQEWDWTLSILEKDLYALITPPKGNAGKGVPRFVSISALDLAGKSSETVHWQFSLDTASPAVNFTGFTALASGKVVFEGASDITMSGTVTDDNRVKTIRYYLQKYNYATSTWEYYNHSTGAWNAAVTSVPAGSLANYWSTYTLENPKNEEFWYLSGSGATGTFKLNPGIYGSGNIFDGTKGQGQYRLYIEATDYSLGASAGNLYATHKDFYVDRSEPDIAWGSLGKTYYRNKLDGSLEFAVTVKDPNYIANPLESVRITGPNGAVYPVPNTEIDTTGARTIDAYGVYAQTITLKPTGGTTSWVSGGKWNSGKYTVTLIIKDEAGKEGRLDYSITVDNDAPVIEINNRGGASSITVNEAITGRQEFVGKFTKASLSPVVFVAFYVSKNGSAAPGGIPAADVDINLTASSSDLTALQGAGWRFFTDAGNNDYKLTSKLNSDPTNKEYTLMRIPQGLKNVTMVIPDTRDLLNATPDMYAATEVNASGQTWNGGAIPTTDKVNKLQIYFLAIDEAGNRTVQEYNYWIYPEGDRPLATITAPNGGQAEEQRLLNGRIRVGGNATDNVRVKNVWFRILGDDGTTPIATLEIPRWNQSTWEAETTAPLTQTPQNNFTFAGVNRGDGWYMANGGGKKDVSWWAYVNTTGELDPTSGNNRTIYVQVMAEDTSLDDDTGEYRTGQGLASKIAPDFTPGTSRAPGFNPDKTVYRRVAASVVKGAPEFSGELVRRGASGASPIFGTIGISDADFTNYWNPSQSASISKRAAYAVTVTHDAGVKEIQWIQAGGNPIDLLNSGEGYNTATYAANLANMNASVPSGTGIAIKAGPKKVLSGSQTLASGKRYLIWKYDAATASSGLASKITGYDAAVDWRLTTIAGDGSTVNLGNSELMESNADNKFEWVVIADIHGDLLKDENGNSLAGTAGYSVLNLQATDNSQPVALSMRHEALLPIDNLPPRGAYTHNPYVAGAAATFGGAAGDSGDPAGVAKIVLWFSRKDGSSEASIPWYEVESDGTPSGKSFTGGGTVPAGVTLPNGVAMPADYAKDAAGDTNYSSIVIEANDPTGQNTVYGHQRPIGFASVGGVLGTAWYVTLDSTLLKSGRITAHYIVYDKAGNATYYSQRLIVMNGVPRIRSITLATDIRGDTGLTDAANFNRNKTWGDALRTTTGIINNDNVTAPPLTTIGNAVTAVDANALTDAQKGISEPATIDTTNKTKLPLGPVYTIMTNAAADNAFNARNNVLAIQVDVGQDLGAGSKDRTFHVEYVSGARLLTDDAGAGNGNGNSFYKKIKAGRIYIVEESGSTTNRFPWGSFGAQGENPPKGSVFMAVENGEDMTIPYADYRRAGTLAPPSVWELNSTYYTNPAVDHELDRTVPAKLQLSDVNYPNQADGTNGKSAVFVYANNTGTNAAFGTAPGSAIVDYNPNASDNAAVNDVGTDGRTMPYPFNSFINGTESPSARHSLFIVKVFGGPESDLFGDFALLSIRVNNNDKTKPYAQLYDLNPKTEGQETAQTQAQAMLPYSGSTPRIGANRTKGGLYNAGNVSKIVKSGHIEPRSGTSLTSGQMGGAETATRATITKPFVDRGALFGTDTVSGDVILRGYVEDDQRIDSVDLTIGGRTLTILERKTGFGLQAASNEYAAGRVAFYETVDLDRHRVEWAYLWKTETVPGGDNVVATGMTVRAIAYNANSTRAPNDAILLPANPDSTWNYFNPDASATDSNYRRYNEIAVNLRPYITGFRRNRTAFAHDTRSRQGRYMFARGETVVVAGFNLLNNNNNNTSAYIALPGMNSTQTGNVGTIADYGITAADNIRYRQFTVGDAARTSSTVDNNDLAGLVTLTVGNNNFPAVNTGSERAQLTAPTRPRAIQPWNVEYSPGTLGSELWDDFTQVHIWQSNQTVPGTNTATNGSGRFYSSDNWSILNPAMSIAPDGTLYEGHIEGGKGTMGGNSAAVTANSITNTAINRVMQWGDPIFFSDIYRSPGISGAGVIGGTGGTGAIAADTWMVFSVFGRGGGNQEWTALGGAYLYGPGGAGLPLNQSGANGTDLNSGINTSAYHVESTWYNASSNAKPTTPPSTDQFINPHIVTSYSGTGASRQENIHVAYYDSKDGSIKYRYNVRGAPNAIHGGAIDNTNNGEPPNNGIKSPNDWIPKLWTNLDGGLDDEDADATGQQRDWTLAEANRRRGNPPTGTTQYLADGTTYITGGTVTANQALFRVGTTIIYAPVSGTISNVIAHTTNITNTGTRIFTIDPSSADKFTTTGQRVVRYSTNIAGTVTARGNINAGKHNAIAVTNQGHPVIAYYDQTNQRLKLAVSNDVRPIAAANWIIRDFVIPESNPISFGTGEFVSMKIDTQETPNIIHIAAMHTSKKLVYVTGKINTFAAGAGNLQQLSAGVLTDVKVQVVDGLKDATVGRWCALSLDGSGRPWISYMDESWLGARDGVKVAYLNTTAFYKEVGKTDDKSGYIDPYGVSLAGWEIMHVPTTFRVENPLDAGREHGRLGLECYPPRNIPASGTKFWYAAVGYLSQDREVNAAGTQTAAAMDRYRVAYYVK